MEPSYSHKSIRSSAVLTGSYVAATVLEQLGHDSIHNPVENNQLILYISLTIGSLTSAEVKVEFSDDGTNYYQESSSAVSSGTATVTVLGYTFTATGNYRIPVSVGDRYVKVSAKGTGTVTNSLMAIEATLANK